MARASQYAESFELSRMNFTSFTGAGESLGVKSSSTITFHWHTPPRLPCSTSHALPVPPGLSACKPVPPSHSAVQVCRFMADSQKVYVFMISVPDFWCH